MRKRNVICTISTVAVVAISAMSLGFASWRTDITANGNVNTNGNWDISITDASLKTSTGTSVSAKTTALLRSNVKGDALIASTISSSTWLSADQKDLMGTQSNESMSKYTYYYAVDSQKYDLSDITAITEEEYATISADPSTFVVSDHLKMYYRYVKGLNDGSAAATNESAAKVVDGLLRDTTAALKELYPDTWQNYTLVNMDKYGRWNYVIADMQTVTVSGSDLSEDELASFTDTEASYADVSFAVPGAWAAYDITVTNNGTVNASLANATITLNTENADQLELSAPNLTDEILAPGESCTIQAVLKALDNGTDSLNASGTLEIKLPYAQESIEAAPEASHSHN